METTVSHPETDGGGKRAPLIDPKLFVREDVVRFGNAANLVGIICHSKKSGANRPGILFLNAGLIHRCGPNRLYVKLARLLATRGYSSLRFDLSGRGDSSSDMSDRSFNERALDETLEATEQLAAFGCSTFVPLGICSGAITALDAAQADPRICGAVLINPLFFDDNSTAFVDSRDTKYWARVLTNPKRWRDFFSGKAEYDMILNRLKGLFETEEGSATVIDKVVADLDKLADHRARTLIVGNELDPRQLYLVSHLEERCRDTIASKHLTTAIIPGADHIFTPLRSQERLFHTVIDWLTAA